MAVTPVRTSFVGCGRVGRSLGRLFARRNLIEVFDVLAPTLESADAACAVLGSGRAVADASVLAPVQLIFVLTTDAALAEAADRLAKEAPDLAGAAVVHASGALSSEVLAPLRARGCAVASIHPIRSFAAALDDDDMLDGVVCGAEGDAEALALALPLFEAAGAQIAPIDAASKRLYHAAAVLACNHLVGLVESSLETYAAAGVDRTLALRALEPLIRGTVDNIFTRGPEHSLSGPIVRGEARLVEAQLADLGAVSPDLREIYRLLARSTHRLAQQVGEGKTTGRAELDRVLGVADTEGED